MKKQTTEAPKVDSSACLPCSIAWSAKPPTEKGMFLWRTEPGVMLAIVYTMKLPDGGELIGKVYGHGGRHFYEACPVGVWGGEWLGPLPTQ